jgi:sugar phosphate permease
MDSQKTLPAVQRAWFYASVLFVGYVGVYLCRKNLATALPLIQKEFGVSKVEAGAIASFGTLAYGLGKFLLGPVVDRLGGRLGFLLALLGVAVFTALGGFAPGLAALIGLHSANRFCGAAAWGSMVKQVPDWFPKDLRGRALAFLCLSYVIGGACALWLAARIAQATHNQWRAILSLPAIPLAILLVFSWWMLPRRPLVTPEPNREVPASPPSGVEVATARNGSASTNSIAHLWVTPAFLALAAVSFATTLARECLNTWTVDYLITAGNLSIKEASDKATWFDLAGVLGIVASGWMYDRASRGQARWITTGILTLLAINLAAFGRLAGFGTGVITLGIAGSGLLLYGPYSLLSGALAVDIAGPQRAATAACWIDAVGYLAGVAAGSGFGKLVQSWGYATGFLSLGILIGVAAVVSPWLFVRSNAVALNESSHA